eukprot:TRINITY_DN41465_c0_g1_i1.p1 TRINITY_DN41465_c0_g1~~TRINITY_DN41465_c0_g1_i1.p1  ORF type:complete len:717 (-),score=108.71 TRINITY_DN41465_c0_g1_i1:122-2272(-)
MPATAATATTLAASLVSCVDGWAWRPTLQRQQHIVELQETSSATSAASAGATVVAEPPLSGNSLWQGSLQVGADMSIQCELQGTLASAHASAEAKRREYLAARWAPLRHRCHAWRRSEHTVSSPHIATDEDPEVPWIYRICFASEAIALAPSPWLERVDFGMYNSSFDEDHLNGSLTLHYVNTLTQREATVSCHCGEGGPSLDSWHIRNGVNHSFSLSLPSCCSLRAEGKRLDPEASFRWLSSPLASLQRPCYGHRRGRWIYQLCLNGDATAATLSRTPAASKGSSASTEDKALEPPWVKLGGQNEHAVPTETKAIRLVRARPAVIGQAVGGDSSSLSIADPKGAAAVAAVPADLAKVLSRSGRGHHRAMEMELPEGSVCRGTNGTLHRTRVRWICPANWQKAAPDKDGGHTALVAVERPSGCDWVAWMASLLLCSDVRLLPPSSEASSRSISCRSSADAQSVNEMPVPDRGGFVGFGESDAALLQEESFLRERTADLQFHVGQSVEVSADGTEGVVVGWDLEPDTRILHLATARQSASSATGAHYLVMAMRGQLPLIGALPFGAFRLPGHAFYLPQDALVRVERPAGGAHPSRSLTLPPAVEKFFFQGMSSDGERYVPAPWLARRYPLDGVPTTPEGTTDEKLINTKSTSNEYVRELMARVEAARGPAVAFAESEELKRKGKRDAETLEALNDEGEKLESQQSQQVDEHDDVIDL